MATTPAVPPAQKYITFMYPAMLEPALCFLRKARCTHDVHAKVAVGFDENGISNGAPTGTYPAELNRILARAFAYPHVSASDEHWATIAASFPYEIVMPVDTSEPTEQTTGPPVEDITEVDTTGGITGDRRGDGEG